MFTNLFGLETKAACQYVLWPCAVISIFGMTSASRVVGPDGGSYLFDGIYDDELQGWNIRSCLTPGLANAPSSAVLSTLISSSDLGFQTRNLSQLYLKMLGVEQEAF